MEYSNNDIYGLYFVSKNNKRKYQYHATDVNGDSGAKVGEGSARVSG